MSPRALARAAVLLLAGACSPYVQHGETLYVEGRYIEAAEVFERTEPRLARSGAGDCARYGLYRGLTLLALGDLAGARQWLAYAARTEQQAPGALGNDDRARLAHARADLETRARSAPAAEKPEAPRVASTETVALPRRTGPTSNGRRSLPPE